MFELVNEKIKDSASNSLDLPKVRIILTFNMECRFDIVELLLYFGATSGDECTLSNCAGMKVVPSKLVKVETVVLVWVPFQ